MPTQTYDDGSTLTWSDDYGYVSSTPAPSYSAPINNSSFPAGSAIVNALANGFGRWVDYKTTPAPQQNMIPLYQGNGLANGPALVISPNMILLAAAGGLIYLLASGAK